MKKFVAVLVSMLVMFFVACGGGGGGKSDNTTELEGTWYSDCNYDSVEDAYMKSSFTFTEHSLTSTTKAYKDFECTITDDEYSSYTDLGTFIIGDSITTNSGASAKKIDITTLKEDGLDVNKKEYDIYTIIDEKLYVGDSDDQNDGSTIAKRPKNLDMDNYLIKEGSIRETSEGNIIAVDTKIHASVKYGILNAELYQKKFQEMADDAKERLVDMKLPSDVSFTINFSDCGVANAFYSRDSQNVTMCYELFMDMIATYNNFLEYGKTPSDKEIAVLFYSTMNTYEYILMHEISHTFIDQIDFDILGGREDIADAIAAVLMIEKPDTQDKDIRYKRAIKVIFGGLYLEMVSSTTAYAGTHTVGPQRNYNLICLAVGAENDILSNDYVFDRYKKLAGRSCDDEYENNKEDVYKKFGLKK